MPDKVVSVELRAKVDGAVAGFKKAKSAVDDLTKAASPAKADAFSKMADKAALAGVGIAGALTLAVKRFADFDQAMSAVQANSGATGATLDALRQQAIKLGADSQFSATEAAQGVNELAKAGVDAGNILGGGLKGSLDLAAAGQISVADAAETAATAMTQFKLSGDQVPHIADLLANAANKAQGGVGDMALALKQAGLVAASTGLSIEETTAGLTAFASAGLIGSDAGTSFKTMLQRLSAPSTDAQKAMDKLGITAYDSQGNFIGLANVAQQLKDGLSQLTPEQRNAALATIFGSDAIRAANVLYEQGAAGINKWTKEVSEQGAAAKQAATLTDNLKGDVERLGGALDSVFIQTGTGANSSLRTLVQGVTGLVDKVGAIPGPLLLAGGALTAFALLAPKGVLEYRKYKAQLDSLGLSLDKISAKAPRTGAALERGAAGAKKAGVAFLAATAAAGTLDQAFGKSGNGIGIQGLTKDLLSSDDAVKTFSARIKTYADSQSNWFNGDAVTSYGAALKAAFDPSAYQQIDKAVGSLAGVSTDVDNAKAHVSELDQVLTGLVQGGQADKASALFNQFAKAANDSGVSTELFKSKLPGFTEAMAAAGSAAASAGPKQVDLGDNIEQVQQAANDAKDALDKYVQGLQNAGLVVLDTRSAQREFKQSIVDAKKSIDENGRSLDINTQKGRDNQAALDKVASSALGLADAVYKQTGSESAMRASLVSSRDALIRTATRFGMTRGQAEAYADSIIKIPAAKTTTATFRTVGLSELQAAGNYLRGLQDKRITLTVGTVKVGSTKVNAGQFAAGGAAVGPGTGTSDSIDAKLSNGEHVWTAEEVQKAGGQGAMYRARAAVRNGVLKFAKGGAVRFADGGQVDFSAILALISQVTSWEDVVQSRGNRTSKANAVTAAANALRSLQNQQRAVARSLRTAKGTSRANLLDRERLLLGQVAAAEGKLTAARKASTDAARAQQKVEAQYAADRKPLIDRTTAAATSTNKVTKTFLDNIEKLNRMGFRSLALQLLDQGGPEAETLAAQAVASAAKARALQSQFATSAALDARSESIKAALSGQLVSAPVVLTAPPVGRNVFTPELATQFATLARNVFEGAGIYMDGQKVGQVVAKADARNSAGGYTQDLN